MKYYKKKWKMMTKVVNDFDQFQDYKIEFLIEKALKKKDI